MNECISFLTKILFLFCFCPLFLLIFEIFYRRFFHRHHPSPILEHSGRCYRCPWTLDQHPDDVSCADGTVRQRWIWVVTSKLQWVMPWPLLSDHCLPSAARPPLRLYLCLLRPSLTQGWEKNESCMLVCICSSQHLSITSSFSSSVFQRLPSTHLCCHSSRKTSISFW